MSKRYNCQLDALERANVLTFCHAYDDSATYGSRFMNSADLAKEYAGIAWRAYVNGTVEVIEDSYNYAIGCHVFDVVNYGNDYTEEFTITDAPAYTFDGFDVAHLINREANRYEYADHYEQAAAFGLDTPTPSAFGFREFDIISNCTGVDYCSHGRVQEWGLTDRNGNAFYFIVEHGFIKITG